MRIISFLILVTLVLFTKGQSKNPFLSIKFDKVLLYDYEPYGENPSLVDNEGQILNTVNVIGQSPGGRSRNSPFLKID